VRLEGLVTAALLSALVACGGTAEEPGPDAAPAPQLDRGTPGAVRGSFQLTYYYVTAAEDFTGAADTPLYDDRTCAVIDRVPARFAAALEQEGTGRLADGRVITSAACGCGRGACYHEVDADHPWGEGVHDRALVPFRTIAVDRGVIAYGTHLYIEELDGAVMPGDAPWGGFVHDGCVIADDTGPRITGAHVDLFSAVHAGYVALDGQLGVDRVTIHDGGTRCP
jgi:3D (Asp-Asp-Asp) domain-containing protein